MFDIGKDLKEAYEQGYQDRDKEIVRCKDCEYWRNDTDHTCRYHGGAINWLAKDFCSYGVEKMERKEK